jgi:hypothetical protein
MPECHAEADGGQLAGRLAWSLSRTHRPCCKAGIETKIQQVEDVGHRANVKPAGDSGCKFCQRLAHFAAPLSKHEDDVAMMSGSGRPAMPHPGNRGKLMSKAALLGFVVEIVRRIDHEPGFKVLLRRPGGLLTAAPSGGGSSVCRRVMGGERTFGWMVRWRRLVLRRISHDVHSQTGSSTTLPHSV